MVRRFFGNDLGTDLFTQQVTWMPAVEVTENDKEILVTAELPGMTDKDVEISFEDDVLTISGEKKEEHREERDDNRFYVWERSYGSFRRSFSLPGNVNAAQIAASFQNGILTVRLPKSETEKARGRKIPISVGK
jgi:HSP20 family protein